jgi:predicted DsbA family dithiol-disulfide isomerase
MRKVIQEASMSKVLQKLKIDVYSDVVCPWCFIGAERLRQVLASLPEPMDVELSYKTYLLDPGTPAEGKDLARRLEAKYGLPAAEIFSRPTAAAQELGLPLDFSKVPNTYNTINAHTLLRHAAPGQQAALARAFFEAYFLEGKNISQEAVLQPLAQAHGFSAETVSKLLADEAEKRETLLAASDTQKLGIRGVPTFVFNDRVGFSGAQPEAIFRQAIAESLEPAS